MVFWIKEKRLGELLIGVKQTVQSLIHCLALLLKVLSDANMMLKAAKNPEQDEFDELTFLVGKAIEAVNSWKAHQLPVVHQDQAWLVCD